MRISKSLKDKIRNSNIEIRNKFEILIFKILNFFVWVICISDIGACFGFRASYFEFMKGGGYENLFYLIGHWEGSARNRS